MVFSSRPVPAGEPDVGRVEVLERRDVDRVVHLAGVVVGLQRAGDREERRVGHDLLVGLGPQVDGLLLGLGSRRRLVDQGVGLRAVVEPEVAADRRERGLPENRGAKNDSAALPYQSGPHPEMERSQTPVLAEVGFCRYFV